MAGGRQALEVKTWPQLTLSNAPFSLAHVIQPLLLPMESTAHYICRMSCFSDHASHPPLIYEK